ncbi:MAG: hypothetical protein AAGA70_16900 [Pseudomonadota bacterium]
MVGAKEEQISEDRVELDTIIGLESRITAALDRIAGAAAANAVAAAANAAPDPALAEAEARIDALSAELSAASDARAAADAEAERLRGELATVQASAADASAMQHLREKADRLRNERNTIRDERDKMAEELDAFHAGATGQAEKQEAAEMLAALRELRQANEDLRAQSEAMRQAAASGEGAPAPETLNAAMAAELLSLRAERAADAAEMQIILDELRPLSEPEGHVNA